MNGNKIDVEEKMYSDVVDEIKAGQVSQGLFAKALAESNGNKTEAESRYVTLRVDQLKREMIIESDEKKRQKNTENLEVLLRFAALLAIVWLSIIILTQV